MNIAKIKKMGLIGSDFGKFWSFLFLIFAIIMNKIHKFLFFNTFYYIMIYFYYKIYILLNTIIKLQIDIIILLIFKIIHK